MITISLTTALILYSGVLAVTALVLWVYTELSTGRTLRVLEKQNLWRCAYCGYVYLDEGAGTLSHCPRCGIINETGEAQDRLVRFGKEQAAADAPEPEDTGEAEPPRRNPSHRKRTRPGGRGPRRRR